MTDDVTTNDVPTEEKEDSIYEETPLKDVPKNRKLVAQILRFLIIITSIWGFFLFGNQCFLDLSIDRENDPFWEEEIEVQLPLGMASGINTFVSISLLWNSFEIYKHCCKYQYFSCKPILSCFTPFVVSIMYAVACFVEVRLCLSATDCLYTAKIVTMVCCISTFVLAIANFIFAAICCQCKQCQKTEGEIRITFNNVTVVRSLESEYQYITESELKEWFKIPNSYKNRLGIEDKSGKIILEFNYENTWTYLEEGEFKIREIETKMIPFVNDAAKDCFATVSKVDDANNKTETQN